MLVGNIYPKCYCTLVHMLLWLIHFLNWICPLPIQSSSCVVRICVCVCLRAPHFKASTQVKGSLPKAFHRGISPPPSPPSYTFVLLIITFFGTVSSLRLIWFSSRISYMCVGLFVPFPCKIFWGLCWANTSQTINFKGLSLINPRQIWENIWLYQIQKKNFKKRVCWRKLDRVSPIDNRPSTN